jgi:hypothetical protein
MAPCQNGTVPVMTALAAITVTNRSNAIKDRAAKCRHALLRGGGRCPHPLQTGQNASASPHALPVPLQGGHADNLRLQLTSRPVPWHFLQTAWYFPQDMPVPLHGGHFMCVSLPISRGLKVRRLQIHTRRPFLRPLMVDPLERPVAVSARIKNWLNTRAEKTVGMPKHGWIWAEIRNGLPRTGLRHATTPSIRILPVPPGCRFAAQATQPECWRQ